jgi:hypothetical protein
VTESILVTLKGECLTGAGAVTVTAEIFTVSSMNISCDSTGVERQKSNANIATGIIYRRNTGGLI